MTLKDLQRTLSLSRIPLWIIVPLGVIWCVLFIVLLVSLFWVLFEMPRVVGNSDETAGQIVLRFSLLSIAALTATLGAVVTLPLTLVRIQYTRRQTETIEQGLITDRINKAVEMLGRRRW